METLIFHFSHFHREEGVALPHPEEKGTPPTSLQYLTPSQGILLLPNWFCVLFLSDLSAHPDGALSAPASDMFGFNAGSLDYRSKATFLNQFYQ